MRTLTFTLAVAALATTAAPLAAQTIGGCPLFPPNNIWTTRVDKLDVHPSSAAWIATIGSSTGLHPDFGSGEWPPGSGLPIGIPYVVVPQGTARVAIEYLPEPDGWEDESDPGPYPIPPTAPVEGGSDHHVLVVEQGTCELFELYNAEKQNDNSWTASSGAHWFLNSHALRPDGWTSADAAGLPILPGLVRRDEVLAGEIRHALRFTADNDHIRNAYVWPARHESNTSNSLALPPMGQRFRLKSSFVITGFSPEMQVILTAMKRYGIILADNGSDWYISGAPHPDWDNDILHEIDDVLGSDFEAVDTSWLMGNADSGFSSGISRDDFELAAPRTFWTQHTF